MTDVLATWLPFSLEAAADAGIELTPGQESELARREAELLAWERSLRGRYVRVRSAMSSWLPRLRHAVASVIEPHTHLPLPLTPADILGCIQVLIGALQKQPAPGPASRLIVPRN